MTKLSVEEAREAIKHGHLLQLLRSDGSSISLLPSLLLEGERTIDGIPRLLGYIYKPNGPFANYATYPGSIDLSLAEFGDTETEFHGPSLQIREDEFAKIVEDVLRRDP